MKLIRDGEKGGREGGGMGVGDEGGGWCGGGRGKCTYRYTVTTRTSSDESPFSVSLIVRDRVTIQCPQTTTCFLYFKTKESRSGIEPRAVC